MNALRHAPLVILAGALAACSTLSYRGAMIDARDSIAERHYDRALDDLDRASQAKLLSPDEERDVEALSELCKDHLPADDPRAAERR